MRAHAPAVLGLACLACCASDRRDELENVAKDWCLTIRASQVIPVYPLTEDLRPGDVFLVSRRIDQDAYLLDEKGFLPLDLNLARLDLSKELKLASVYQHPIGNSLDGAKWPPFSTAFETMSRTGFPTYRVEVDRQLGLDLALPIQAVPVSLSAMRADRGTATVALTEAYTYGLDVQSLQAAMTSWTDQHATMNMLAQAAASLPRDGGEGAADATAWIRIVTRVFLVKSVSVDVTTDSATGANVGAGVDAPASRTIDLDEDVVKRARAAAESSPTVPGAPAGRLQYLSATSRSVTMKESFPRPIVVGYLAYQARLNPDGTLGGELAPTLELLTDGLELADYEDDPSTETIRKWMSGHDDRIQLVRKHIDANVPGKPDITVVLHGRAHAWDRRRIVEEVVNAVGP